MTEAEARAGGYSASAGSSSRSESLQIRPVTFQHVVQVVKSDKDKVRHRNFAIRALFFAHCLQQIKAVLSEQMAFTAVILSEDVCGSVWGRAEHDEG